MELKDNIKKIISLGFVLFFLLILSIVFIVKQSSKEKSIEDLINISSLSEEFLDNYFEETSNNISNEEKENMLIVISEKNIVDSYGANKVIEAPNNQYILQYDSKEEKDQAFEKLKDDKYIKSVNENGFYTINEADYNSWGVEATALDYAISSASSNISNMNPVTVAIIDTGCDINLFNKYYAGKITEFYNVLEKSTTVMLDEDGHGTHVAGTIAESTPYNVKILPIKVSRDGNMYYSDIIAAINYIVSYGKADVINMSFGGYGYHEPLEQAIESARQQNIISVAAAGNDNTSKKHYPSGFDNTISISSLDSELNKSSFSNYGASVTFAAPGTAIKSIMGKDAAISKRNGNKDGDDDHETISGTSMATPHAVSAVAILKSYNKDLTLENVVDILKDNSIDLGEEGWDQYYGNGLISFADVQFCDGTYCDELGVYKDLTKNITEIEFVDLKFTDYNYYSLTNIMGSKVNASYTDGTNEEIAIGKLPNVEILNYDPLKVGPQTVTIKVGNITSDISVTNPDNYESGWEYNELANGKIEITGYKNHNLEIEKVYIPEIINSKQVVSFADDFKFSESGNDFEFYTYLYLPSSFTRIGNYSLSETKINYVYGSDNKLEIGAHAFENSEIVSIDSEIIKIEDYAFKDCFELVSIKVWEEDYAWNTGEGLEIGNYAFYNCKKLASIEMSDNAIDNIINDIGDYAFYNCVSLAYFDLDPGNDIGDYAFYNTFLLNDIYLYYSNSIGQYAFYGSGISEVSFSISLEVVNESAFENCRNLKNVSFNGGRIEKKAFWNSGVESIDISSRVEYIAEDAFAYTPMKKLSGGRVEEGAYKAIYGLGIVESATNKLLIGHTNALGASNTEIPEYITEIGNYAFTGNNTLEKIIIPENVTKIGEHAFEDCYNLSNVYMLVSALSFGDSTFKRNYDGQIQGADLNIYVYKDSEMKQMVKNKGLNYRHIEPDEIIVTNYNDTYTALETVDFSSLTTKLIYHEEEDREEILKSINHGITTPLGYGVGTLVTYQTESYRFQYGDTYFVVTAKNAVGYSAEKKVYVTVEQATPTYTVPTGLTALFGQKLSEIELPTGFEWMDANQIIIESGEVVYKAKYIPTDTKNYKTIEDIDITVLVNNPKTIIVPEIVITNKVYDGTTDIPLLNITVSNLEASEYTIVSAISSNADSGESNATVKLKLSDEKFVNYSFDNGKQEKDFEISFEILKASINVIDNSKDVKVKYDGNQHSVEIDLEIGEDATIKYMDENNEYTLDVIPKYIDIGTYVIKYKVYINDNYNDYFGEKTLYIEEVVPYIINKYSVDETNKYIDLIDINTTVEDFLKNIELDSSYTIEVESKIIDEKEVLYTGGKTKIYKDNELYIEYTNIVRGDVNGNGKIDIYDYIRIMKDIMDETKLSGIYQKAADITLNNKVDIYDYIRIMKKIMEEE